MKKSPVFLCLSLAFLFACKKHAATPPLASGVYAVGYTYPTPGGSSVAAIWKNGVETKLSADIPSQPGATTATGIAILGSDIYVTGDSAYNAQPKGAILWKNGAETFLQGGSQANGIVVNGSDIYITGQNILGYPCYWKNGVQTTLSNYYGIGQCILFNGTDMYVAGVSDNPAATTIHIFPAYWKNGVLTFLTDTAAGGVNSMAITGDDLYFGGYVEAANYSVSFGYYWTNGQQISLPASIQGYSVGRITGAATDGVNIYFSGWQVSPAYDTIEAVYWKNGVPAILPTPTVREASAFGVTVYSGDVYVEGSMTVATDTEYGYAAYWKNGIVVQLSAEPASNAVAIAIVP